ncbi:hypothetical protein BH23PSE1_BH23PSE1_11320 [soil metagenome]
MVRKGAIVAHVAEATGMTKADIATVLDAAFDFIRAKVLAGEDVQHGRLGRLRVRSREGARKTVYRYVPAGGEGAEGDEDARPDEAG